MFYDFLQTRGIDINALVNSTSLPPLTYIDAETRVDLEGKSIVLKDHWTYLDRILDWRIQLSELYVKFYTSSEHLNIEFSNLDSIVGNHVDVSDQRLDSAHKYWTSILQLYIQLKNTGEKFLHQSSKVSLLIIKSNNQQVVNNVYIIQLIFVKKQIFLNCKHIGKTCTCNHSQLYPNILFNNIMFYIIKQK